MVFAIERDIYIPGVLKGLYSAFLQLFFQSNQLIFIICNSIPKFDNYSQWLLFYVLSHRLKNELNTYFNFKLIKFPGKNTHPLTTRSFARINNEKRRHVILYEKVSKAYFLQKLHNSQVT